MHEDPVVAFPSREAWAAWLAEEHERSEGVWLQLAKKGSGEQTVTYAEAVEVALCWGWIDGQKRASSDTHSLQRFTRRRPRSKWSKINRAKAEALIARGEMQPPGLAAVEAAKADGRWDAAYDSPRTATVPDDLRAALDANPAAAAFFATLKSASRYSILYRLQDAKRRETRARRIAQFVAMLAEGKAPYA